MSKEYGRREFLTMMGSGAVVGAAAAVRVFTPTNWEAARVVAGIGSGLLTSWAEGVDPPRTEIRRNYPQAGWLETSLPGRPELINAKTGCGNYIRYCCLNNPILREASRRSFNDFFKQRDQPPRLGNIFLRNYDIAETVLREELHQTDEKLKGRKPKTEDIIHVAMFTMAAVLSPYFSVTDIKRLGVNINPPPGVDNDKVEWLHFIRTFMPKVLPVSANGCHSRLDFIANCDGGDRSMHFMQHFFLVYQMQYALSHNLQDVRRIPRGADFARLLIGIPYLSTFLVDNVGGLYWEVKETKAYDKGEGAYDELGKLIPTGFRDQFVRNDLITNNLGAFAGLALNIIPLDYFSVAKIAELLDSDDLYEVTQLNQQGYPMPNRHQEGVAYPIYSSLLLAA